jgi:cysteine desulfurase
MPLFRRSRVYLDYASATPLCTDAARAVRGSVFVGNPGAIHREGVEAKRSLEQSRSSIARFLECKAREIIFTSGATEANNLALLGYARDLSLKRRTLAGTRWLVASIEHPSVLEPFSEIERLGGTVIYIEPDERGIVTAESVARHLTKEVVCLSVGWGNGEIGVVQPLAKIARVLRAHERAHGTTVLFHADAGQAPLYEKTTVHSLGVDLLTLDSAKLYGPHGIGLLYMSDRADLSHILFGGSQERGLRPGTENVALAAGFAAALVHVASVRDSETKRLRLLQGELAEALQRRVEGVIINASLTDALPHILNISVPNIQSEYITLALDHKGFAISTKSACREGEERESHVVRALGRPEWRATNTLRISFGEATSKSDIHRFIDALSTVVLNPGRGRNK